MYPPPMIVFPGQRLRDLRISDFPEAVYGRSDSGWMNEDLFLAYLLTINDFVTAENIPKPVVIYVDGHSSQLTLTAAEYCSQNNIILYCLLAHATHLLQPCDVSFFAPLKICWM